MGGGYRVTVYMGTKEGASYRKIQEFGEEKGIRAGTHGRRRGCTRWCVSRKEKRKRAQQEKEAKETNAGVRLLVQTCKGEEGTV